MSALLLEPEARRLTERIRTALDRVSSAWADLGERITEAYERRADLALGYGSWAEYAEAELKPSGQIAAEVRRELVSMLSAKGMSTRAIAPTVGRDSSVIRRDLQVVQVAPPAPNPEHINPVTGEVVESHSPVGVTGRDADEATEAAERATVTGLDGKTYTRTPPKNDRRAPLRDGFRDAALDLGKIVARFERLSADDRLPRNREEVARYANDLTLACDALQRVAANLTK